MGAQAKAKTGDHIVVEAHRVGEPHRTGKILEVVGEAGREHYRVRWESGEESIFYPSSDARIIPAREVKKKV